MKLRLALLVCLNCPGWTLAGSFQLAYEAALINDATFQAARADLASSQQSLPMARAGLLPNISLSWSEAKVEGSRTVTNVFGQPVASQLDYRAPVQSLNIRVPIFNWEATQKVNLAQAQVTYAETIFANRKLDLIDRLANAYLLRLSAEEALLAARAQVDVAQAQNDLARRRLQLGEGTRPDVGEAEAALDVANAQLLEARSQINTATLGLRQISGIDIKFPATLPDRFTPPPLTKQMPNSGDLLAELLSMADLGSPSIAARKQATVLAQTAVTRNGAGHYPRLDLVANATSSRNESLSTLNQSANQRSLGLQFNLPLYSGGYVNASVAQALADQDKAEAELAAERQLVARDVTRYYSNVVNGAIKVNAYQKAVESTKLSLDGARKGMLSGFNTQADVVLAQRKLSQARYEWAQTVQAYMLARIRLFARVGVEPSEVVADFDGLLKIPQDIPP